MELCPTEERWEDVLRATESLKVDLEENIKQIVGAMEDCCCQHFYSLFGNFYIIRKYSTKINVSQ